MNVEATTDAALATRADTVAIAVFEGEDIAHDLPGGALQALLDRGEAKRRHGHVAVAHAGGLPVVLVGLGSRAEFDAERAREAAAAVVKRARELSARVVCWEVPHHVGAEIVGALVEGTLLADYRYTRYRPAQAADGGLEALIVSAHHDVAAHAARAAVLAAAQNRARDLANAPPNELTPAALAEHATAIAAEHDSLTVEVLDGPAIRAAGMGALAAVAQGSTADPRVIVLDYAGPEAGDRPALGLIGKAVTFDSGGLWLKPGSSQRDMKFDMAGGAAVLAAMWALASLGAPVRVRAVIGATENMPGPDAVKPGSIVEALDGTTIQIDNTDAEGRLLLADCITYAIRSGCEQLIDIATLTGGVVTALGSVHAGLMSNDDDLAAVLERAGAATGELVWRLPLHHRYAAMIEGRYAQIVNVTERREAMAITAAEFLHRFAGAVPWAHLDIAGTAWDARRPYLDRSASGFGTRLLVDAALALGAS